MRVQTLSKPSAALGGLLGLTHIALTPLVHADWTIDALWFVGSGLAILVAAATNFSWFQSPAVSGRWSVTAINLVMCCFFAAAWLVLPGPQVIVGGALFFCLAICTLTAPATKVVTGQGANP